MGARGSCVAFCGDPPMLTFYDVNRNLFIWLFNQIDILLPFIGKLVFAFQTHVAYEYAIPRHQARLSDLKVISDLMSPALSTGLIYNKKFIIKKLENR